MKLKELHRQLQLYDCDWGHVSHNQLQTLITELPLAILTLPQDHRITRCEWYLLQWRWVNQFGGLYIDNQWRDIARSCGTSIYWRQSMFTLFGEVEIDD